MRWVKVWYVSYALLGLGSAGLIPILLPLIVGRQDEAAHVGFVMAAFSLGGLTAPVWGELADRFGLHQWLLVGGLICTGGGAIVFSFALTFALWISLALVIGIGLAAASTVANLFIVEAHPQDEWDARIGWLQTFYGGGQVLGLVLAGLIGQTAPEKGLWIAGATAAIAIIPALSGTRQESNLITHLRPVLSRPVHHSEWPAGSPQHLYHHLSLKGFRMTISSIESPFALFLVAWLLSFSGTAAFFSLYPILMEKVYGILPGPSSVGYAVSAGLGLLLYAPSGIWSTKRGPLSILRYALAFRIAAFLSLTILAIQPFPGRAWFALLSFLIVVLAWSLLSVGSSALVAFLSPKNEGEGMGIFNGITSLSGVIGAALGGLVASRWGYTAIPIMGIAGVALGFLLLFNRFNAYPDLRKHGEAQQ
jgi:DHA1 family tetracycline resistance protein-like MFS transporter